MGKNVSQNTSEDSDHVMILTEQKNAGCAEENTKPQNTDGPKGWV